MKIYVSNYLSNSISVIDYASLEVIKNLSLGQINSNDFIIDKNIIYLLGSLDGNLYLMDLDEDKIIDNISIGLSIRNILKYKNELLIINEDSNSIYILNINNLNPVYLIKLKNTPQSMCINKDKLYVLCNDSITIIDLIKKNIIKDIKTNFNNFSIKIDKLKNEIYISTLEGNILVLNENLEVLKILENFLFPIDIEICYKYKSIYVLDFELKKIIILDYETKKLKDSISFNSYTRGFLVSKDEEYLFVTDTKNNSLKVYQTSKNKLIKEINLQKEPTTIFIK